MQKIPNGKAEKEIRFCNRGAVIVHKGVLLREYGFLSLKQHLKCNLDEISLLSSRKRRRQKAQKEKRLDKIRAK